MMKKLIVILTAAALVFSMAACGKTGQDEPKKPDVSKTDGAKEDKKDGERITLRFYGNIVEDPSTKEKIALAKEHFKDKFNIEEIQVDFENIDTVIKTGISAEDPADIYFYWPQDMRKLTMSDSALDLTPYLTANNNEWLDQYKRSIIDIGKIDGKYYNIPYMMQSSAVMVNDTLAKKLGIEIPDRPTWEEFEDICKKAKDKGVFPFALDCKWSGFFMRNGMLSLANDEGKLEDLGNGLIAADDPIITTALQRAVDMYKNNYLYPGEGAFATSMDEAQTAFAQQKVLMAASVFSMSGTFQKLAKENDFKLRAISWPRMGQKSILLGGANGFIIPVNAKHPEEAVEFLKFYTGPECAAIDARCGMAPASSKVEIEDEIVKAIVDNLDGIYPHELMNLTPELGNYLENECIQSIGLSQSTMEEAVAIIQEHLDAAAK